MDTGTSGAGMSEFSVYRFGVDYPLAPNFLLPNSPLPIAVWQDPDNGKFLPGNNRDAHGMVVIDDELHVFDRVRNTGDIFHMHEPWNILETHDSYDLTESQACGTTLGATTSNDPTPDLGDASPEGDTIFVALRGPFPLTVSHAAAGSCPGLGIIVRDPITREWQLAHVLPSTVLDFRCWALAWAWPGVAGCASANKREPARRKLERCSAALWIGGADKMSAHRSIWSAGRCGRDCAASIENRSKAGEIHQQAVDCDVSHHLVVRNHSGFATLRRTNASLAVHR
jgi:hypothetical protein